MRLETALTNELGTRWIRINSDYEKLLNDGVDPVALDRVIEHAYQIGIIIDKLNNLKIHDILKGEDEDERDVGRIKNVPHSKKKRSEKATARPE